MRDETLGGRTAFFDFKMPDGNHWDWHLTDAEGALQGDHAFDLRPYTAAHAAYGSPASE